MKRLFFLTLVFAGVIIYSACEKSETDVIEDIPESTEEFVVPDIPPEVATYFTEEELKEILAGPRQAMEDQVTMRCGSWHLALWTWSYQYYGIPFIGSCDNPEPCPSPQSCPDPTQWQGFQLFYNGSGMWWGLGPFTTDLNGYQCFYGDSPPWNATLYYDGHELYGLGENRSRVDRDDGSYVMLARAEMVGGTGMFEGATGFVWHRIHGSLDTDFDPATGQPGTLWGATIGWIYF